MIGAPSKRPLDDMSPVRQRFRKIAGCRLVAGRNAYVLEDGRSTCDVAVTVSLLLAEPSLRRWQEGVPIGCEAAVLQGYRLVRSYDEAVMHGLV